jgi:TDG/mug DNA glycosylase family protein
MPSVASLEKQHYYGHPRNAFWPLIAELLEFELNEEYTANVEQAKQHGIAIWDVVGECERPGSLDSAIVRDSERMNPIAQLLREHTGVKRVALNGGTAAQLFKRHILPEIDASNITLFTLPSTSPANARMNFRAKCQAWRPLFNDAPTSYQQH